jgi:hypothetical protein
VTLDELPHAVQILSSTGLIEPERDKPTVTEASQHRADFSYHPHAVNEQVAVHCYTDYKSDTPTGRTRKLEVYLADGDSEPDIVANYDVKFDASGKLAIPGSVTVDVPGTRLTQAFPEDTITLTYQKILNAFKKPYEQAQKDPSILTLENYKPIAQQVATIHHQWTTLMAAK